MQYYNNKNVSLLLASVPIKYLTEGGKVIRSLIAKNIKEGNYYDAYKFVALIFENGSSQIQGVYFDHCYSPVVYADSLRISITIADMHRLTASILDVSNSL